MSKLIQRTTLGAAAAVALVGVPGGTALADSTPSAGWHVTEADWDDPKDKGGISMYEQTSKNGTDEYVMGQFVAHGEKLSIWDYHQNGRSSIVKLWVGDSGPAVFYSHGDGTKRTINLSYRDGQKVKVEACTSDSPGAECTDKLATGRS